MLITPIQLPSQPSDPVTLSSDHPGGWPGRPQVVILGAGFAGLAAARALAGGAADVVVVDRQSSQTLQPLLPALAAGRLAPAAVAVPVAAALERQANARFVRGEVRCIDKAQRTVRVGDRDLCYDFLVVATGARPAASAGTAPVLPLGTVADAVAVRERIRRALAQAERSRDEDERRRLTTFVVVGAGPTGVALAGAVAGLVRQALASKFLSLDPETVKIVLVEAAIRVLPDMRKGLSGIARRALQDLGVELRLGVPVSQCNADGVVLAGKRVPSATVLWAAGVAASPAAGWLDAASDADGRVLVEADLSLPGHPEIFVVGDVARVVQHGDPLPGLAAVANREGTYAALAIAAQIAGKRKPAPFRLPAGRMLAPIGGGFAVGQIGRVEVWGRLGWLAWAAVQLPSVIGIRRTTGLMLRRFGGLRSRAIDRLAPIAPESPAKPARA